MLRGNYKFTLIIHDLLLFYLSWFYFDIIIYRIAGEDFSPCDCQNHTKFIEACDYIIARVDGVRETLESKDKSEEHKKQTRASIEKGNMKITL